MIRVHDHQIRENKIADKSLEPERVVAFLFWGDRFEDFNNTIGMTLDRYCDEWSGGWLFNYIDALTSKGVRSIMFYFSADVTEPTWRVHKATGAEVCVFPVSKLHITVRELAKRTGFPGLHTLASYLATSLSPLAHELRRHRCNAILCQEYEYARFDLCVLLGRLMQIPVFASFQGGNQRLSVLETIPRSLSIRGSSGLIIGSQVEIDRVKKDYNAPPEKIAQIFNPMEVSTWQPFDRKQARKSLGLPIDHDIVVYHGRIEIERKGLDILLEAWQKLNLERTEAKTILLLVGTGTDALAFQQKIDELGLKNIVWINEYIRDRALIRKYLSAADIYVLPSRHEGFPVAPIEAMATGLPVVAANAPGMADIFPEDETFGGLVVPREDSTSLAHSLKRLLNDVELRLQLARKARQRAEDAFSVEAIGQQLYQFLFGEKS